MRHLQIGRRDALAASGEQAEARQVGIFGASLEEPLHAETDAEQRAAGCRQIGQRAAPRVAERPGFREVSDAGNHDGTGAGEILRFTRQGDGGSRRLQAALDRREVAGAVVDEGDHNSPFVLGSVRARRRSRAQAMRSARANALNMASIW